MSPSGEVYLLARANGQLALHSAREGSEGRPGEHVRPRVLRRGFLPLQGLQQPPQVRARPAGGEGGVQRGVAAGEGPDVRPVVAGPQWMGWPCGIARRGARGCGRDGNAPREATRTASPASV